MHRSWLPGIVLVTMAFPVRADLQCLVRHTYGSRLVETTEYYKGSLHRTDEPNETYLIEDRASGTRTLVNVATREYSESGSENAVLAGAADPSHVIEVQVETTETGKLEPAFGHTAHEYITTRTQTGPGQSGQKTRTEAWYLDIPVPPSHTGPGYFATFLVASSSPGGKPSIPELRVIRTGAHPRGLLIRQNTAGMKTEVIQLSEAPLASALFEVPKSYRKVDNAAAPPRLSWDEQIFQWWEQFTDWLSQIF